MYGPSCLAVKNGQVLWTVQHASVLVDIFRFVVSLTYLCLVGSLADVTSCAVYAARCRLANHLGMPVAIEVIDHELGIVSTGTDIPPQVYSPEFSTV